MYVGTQTHYCFFPSKYLEKKKLDFNAQKKQTLFRGHFVIDKHIMDGVTVPVLEFEVTGLNQILEFIFI